jgi:hypothetical protein
MQRGKSDEKFWLSVVVGTLYLSIITDAENAAALPRSSWRRGCPPSPPWLAFQRPTPRRDERTLSRPDDERKRFTSRTPHAIQTVPRATRLTTLLNRFSAARCMPSRSISSARVLTRGDKSESYVVRPIGDQIFLVKVRELFFANYFFGRRREVRSPRRRAYTKKENAARVSGVHIH